MAAMALPGTAEHQRLLRASAARHAGDPRVRVVAVFGSLARGAGTSTRTSTWRS